MGGILVIFDRASYKQHSLYEDIDWMTKDNTSKDQNISPAEINQRNKSFWSRVMKRVNALSTDEVIMDIAQREMNDAVFREVSSEHWKSLEQHLLDEDEKRSRHLRRQAQKGGRAPKKDALQVWIIDVVRRNLDITTKQLLEKLEANQKAPPFEDIVDDEIEFIDTNGKPKAVPLSGLKDRLSRAKKEIRAKR